MAITKVSKLIKSYAFKFLVFYFTKVRSYNIIKMLDFTRHSLSYYESGVDIKKAATLVNVIKLIAKCTYRPGVLGEIGSFAGLFELPQYYKRPVLVAVADGVGTKLKLAVELQQHSTIGIDLVAMCANDVLTTGAEPLFFLIIMPPAI